MKMKAILEKGDDCWTISIITKIGKQYGTTIWDLPLAKEIVKRINAGDKKLKKEG